eukprot:15362222-Ditylum_brightwellii.AAC.1
MKTTLVETLLTQTNPKQHIPWILQISLIEKRNVDTAENPEVLQTKCYQCINAINAIRAQALSKQLGSKQLNGKSTWTNPKKTKSGKKVLIPKCFKHGVVGHLSSKYPQKNNQPEQANTIEYNHFTDSMEEEMLMTAYSDAITGPLYPLGTANDLRYWLIDSGAISYLFLIQKTYRTWTHVKL